MIANPNSKILTPKSSNFAKKLETITESVHWKKVKVTAGPDILVREDPNGSSGTDDESLWLIIFS